MRRLAMALLVAAAGACCRKAGEDAAGAHRLRATVSILPQSYFVKRLAGERVAVNVLVGPGASPATYQPTPRQVAALEQSAVYFRIGVPFENALVPKLQAALPALNIVDTRLGITLRVMDEADGHSEAADMHGGHGMKDPHVWLDPLLVKVQARTICDELKRLDAANALEYERNLAAFHADLDALHERLEALLAPYRGREFYVYHPAFGYFAGRYGLKQTAVEVGGKEPSARHLERLTSHARGAGVRVIFVQREFPVRPAAELARATGAALETLETLAEDYLSSMETLASRLAAAFAASGERPGE